MVGINFVGFGIGPDWPYAVALCHIRSYPLVDFVADASVDERHICIGRQNEQPC
jgi:hypothetical protein